jgi:hypothetical protein
MHYEKNIKYRYSVGSINRRFVWVFEDRPIRREIGKYWLLIGWILFPRNFDDFYLTRKFW